MTRDDVLAIEVARTAMIGRLQSVVRATVTHPVLQEALVAAAAAGPFLRLQQLAAQLRCHGSSLTAAWHRAGLPSVVVIRRRWALATLRAIAAETAHRPRVSLNAAAVTTGFSSTSNMQRMVRAAHGCTARQWLVRVSAAHELALAHDVLAAVDWSRFVLPVALGSLSVADVASPKRRERALEADIIHVRGQLAALGAA